eukprot:scaffold6067_cov112-Isochrysis_galbana.AAC.7
MSRGDGSSRAIPATHLVALTTAMNGTERRTVVPSPPPNIVYDLPQALLARRPREHRVAGTKFVVKKR